MSFFSPALTLHSTVHIIFHPIDSSTMNIVKRWETFKTINGKFQFFRIKFIIDQNGKHYIGYLKHRTYQPDSISQLEDVEEIKTKDRGPEIQPHWTIADLRFSYYLKTPNPDEYLDSGLEARVEREIEVCEIIKQHPHPHLAVYHGCVVTQGKVSGLLFEKYKETLTERVNPNHLSKRAFITSSRTLVHSTMRTWLQHLKSALEHLHSLGYVHNDLTPSNIMFDWDDNPVIIDFDSAGHIGDSLTNTKRTHGWADRNVVYGDVRNDLRALGEIETWLFGVLEEVRFEG